MTAIDHMLKQVEQHDFPIEWPGHWVAGKWQRSEGQEEFTSFSPCNENALMHFQIDRTIVSEAVATAESERLISRTQVHERVEILAQFRQLLTDYQSGFQNLLRSEIGKPLWEAQLDIAHALKYLTKLIEDHQEIRRAILAPAQAGGRGNFDLLPAGVMAAYLPFSTPITSFVQVFAAAVLSGCPLVAMTPAHSSVTILAIVRLLENLTTSPHSLQVLFGSFSKFKQIVADSRVSVLTYTGSREHSEWIRRECASRKNRQLILQSGGKNSIIVHESADLKRAVQCVVYSAFKTAGQLCTSASRLFVHESIYPKFSETLVEAIQAIPLGTTDTPNSDNVFMGPLYSRKAVDKFLRFQTMAHREASEDLLWGKAVEKEGFCVSPGLHLIKSFDPSSSYQKNVLFTPDLALYKYHSLEDAITQSNSTDSAYVVSFLGDASVLDTKRHLFRAPNIMINLPTVEAEMSLPLAGRLPTGQQRFGGAGIMIYTTHPQAIMDATEWDPISSWPWIKF